MKKVRENVISYTIDKAIFSNFAILVDILSWTKFFIAYIGLVNIMKKDTDTTSHTVTKETDNTKN